MNRIYKIPVLSFLLVLFIFSSLPVYLFLNGKTKRKILIKNASLFSRITLFILGVKYKFEGNHKNSNNYLIISNHLSYLDILILLSKFPSVFVSTKEVEKTFLLGFVAKLGGAVFIERRDFSNLKNEIQMITQILKDGFNVVIFPEGTTSDGSCVLDFKAPFLICAKMAGKDILPVCINYKYVNNRPVSAKNKDLIFYYGDMQFFPHVWKLINLINIYVEVKFLNPITTENLNRKSLSSKSKEIISKYYEPV